MPSAAVAQPAVRVPAAVDGAAPLPPLGGPWLERIELAGGGLAFVAPPVGSTAPRPVLVAFHGAMDDPGLACSTWRLITDAYPFVVCPAGKLVRGATYVWPSGARLVKSAEEALAAVRARFGGRVAPGPAVYAGFSQGANLAKEALGRENHGRFAAAILTEGGYRAFDTGAARAFVRAGGERVLFTCSQPGCAARFEASRTALERAGAGARTAYSGPYGHAIPPGVREAIHAELPWLVDRIPGWGGYAGAPKLKAH